MVRRISERSYHTKELRKLENDIAGVSRKRTKRPGMTVEDYIVKSKTSWGARKLFVSDAIKYLRGIVNL